MGNCTSENLEIPGLVLTHHPGMTSLTLRQPGGNLFYLHFANHRPALRLGRCVRVVPCCVSRSWPRLFLWLPPHCSPAAGSCPARIPASRSPAPRWKSPTCPGAPTFISPPPTIRPNQLCESRSRSGRRRPPSPTTATCTLRRPASGRPLPPPVPLQ